MLRYFVAGNLWLFLAVLVYVGQTVERTEPLRYSVFRFGRWFEPSEYWSLTLALIAMSIICFAMYVFRSRKTKP